MRQITDTTASTTSEGNPANCMTEIGFPFDGNRNNWPSTSAMVSPPTLALSNMKAYLASLQTLSMRVISPVVCHARGSVLQLAHALIEQTNQIGQPVRHRSVDRVAGRPRVDSFRDGSFGRTT